MKRCLTFLLTAALLFMLAGCGDTEEAESASAPKQPLNSPEATGGNVISDPITNSNEESAYSDAVNAASQLMSYMADEGIAYIEDGTVFAVEKNGKTYCFKYNQGALDGVEGVPLGSEITPQSDDGMDWLPNVRVFAAP